MRAVDDRLWQGVIASMSATCCRANSFDGPMTQPPQLKPIIANRGCAADSAGGLDCRTWLHGVSSWHAMSGHQPRHLPWHEQTLESTHLLVISQNAGPAAPRFLVAQAAAIAVRIRAGSDLEPVFLMIAARWLSTVRWLMPRSAAMFLLGCPASTRSNIWR